jgi:DNA-binding NarL/FixJ family response regulator
VTAPTRVMLADDHTLVREGVRRILESQPGIDVVAEVASGEALLAALERDAADLVVLDLTMPGLDGFAVLQAIKARWPAIRVLVLTMHGGREYVRRAVHLGVDGYLLKDSAVQDLVGAIDSLRHHRPYFSPAVQGELASLVRPPSRSLVDQLTEREREVLVQVARGRSSKEIAAALDISVRTVETHRANLMRKTGLDSVATLTQFAIREGLVPPG